MERLTDLAADPPAGFKPTRRKRFAEIRDEKTGQNLIVEHDSEIEAFNLDVDKAGWRRGEAHADGLLLADLDGETLVIFVELTGRVTDEPGGGETPAEHKLRQLKGAAEHFHPQARGTPAASHGAIHHDQFADDSDPVRPKPIANHRVLGVVVATRQGSRAPVPPLRIGNTVMQRMFRQVSHQRLQSSTTLRDLLALLKP